jgi:NTP pyrophosphatase (non-canonical NTP hydrolase)
LEKDLSELQHEAADLLGEELKHPRIGAVLSLVEELGELVKEIMEAEIYSKDSPELREKLGDEAADILFSLFEVCTAYDISLKLAYERKLEKIRRKIPLWLETTAEGLRKSRARLDD